MDESGLKRILREKPKIMQINDIPDDKKVIKPWGSEYTIYKNLITILNLDKIQSFIDKKSIDPKEILNSNLLKKLRLINKNSKIL